MTERSMYRGWYVLPHGYFSDGYLPVAGPFPEFMDAHRKREEFARLSLTRYFLDTKHWGSRD